MFATLYEAYLGIWPSVELFWRLLFFRTQTADSIPVTCGAASFYARDTSRTYILSRTLWLLFLL
jgi:hypothetical protein